MKGQIYLVKGKHLVAFNFDTTDEWNVIMKETEKLGFEPYFSAKANITADVVIGALADVTSNPKVQLQSTDPPLCPKHKIPMKASQFGGWFCSKKDFDTYCPIKIDKDGVWHNENGATTKARTR